MTSDQVRRDVFTVFVLFGSVGVVTGTWTSRIPAIKAHLGVPLDQLGLVLLAMGLGSLVAMPFSGMWAKRFGTKMVAATAVTGSILAMMTMARITDPVVFGLINAFAGMCWGTADVVINVQGAAVEAESKKTIMPALHGTWGGGMLIGAAVGALFAKAGVNFVWHITIALSVVLVMTLACLTTWGDYRAITAAKHVDSKQGSIREVLWPTLLIGLMMLGGTFGEGSASDWLAVHMVDERGTSEAMGAALYTCYALFLTTGRLTGHVALNKFGRVGAIRISGVLTFIGVCIVIFSSGVWLPFIGVALWGIGLAVNFPAGISAANEIGGRHSETTIAIVSTMAYGAFLMGPPILGFIGEHWGLRRSFIIPAVLALMFSALAGVAKERTPVEAS